jgi:hypothetical protein
VCYGAGPDAEHPFRGAVAVTPLGAQAQPD